MREIRQHLLFVVNGRSWPNTERLSYELGDTIRWRVLNTTVDPHPMHLHGTYYRIESRGDGVRDTIYASDRRDVVNTEFLAPGATMRMSWSPEHTGNWLFHCHIPEHFGPRAPLGVLRPANHDGTRRVMNHALEDMSGLVMGVTVRSKSGFTRTIDAPQPRRLRLLVRTNVGSTPGSPFYGFALHESGPEPAIDSGLESYYDGVAGFSGTGKHLSPAIAPGDSFEVRFTPPRAGTFMYHTHVDELRQQRAGLAGILVVLEPGQPYDHEHDIAILISSPSDAKSEARSVLLNGSLNPPPLNLRRGVPYRLRFANITTGRPGMRIEMLRDSVLAMWTPIAKDGADLPIAWRVMRSARQRITIGETADFSVTPMSSGTMRVEMRTASGMRLGTLAMQVH